MQSQTKNKDLTGKIIEQKSKDSHSVEIDGNSRFCGKRFLLKTKLFGDKRCIYCGKWFHWKDTDSITWMKEGNIDNYNVDKSLEPLHCGSSHCKDYHQSWKEELEIRKQRVMDGDMWRLFKGLKNKGVVS